MNISKALFYGTIGFGTLQGTFGLYLEKKIRERNHLKSWLLGQEANKARDINNAKKDSLRIKIIEDDYLYGQSRVDFKGKKLSMWEAKAEEVKLKKQINKIKHFSLFHQLIQTNLVNE